MKSIIILLSLFLLVTGVNAQSKKAEPVQTAVKLDSINVKGIYISDTAKVSVLFLNDNGTVTWKKGYQVKTNFYWAQNNALPYSQFLLDDKFKPFKEGEGIADVKLFNW